MRIIKQLDLYEVSVVMHPANPHAVILGAGYRVIDDE